MAAFELTIPDETRHTLREAIAFAAGDEVYFLGRVAWEGPSAAALCEVEVFARGHATAAPAIIEGAESWDVAIHNHPSGELRPSDADLSIAAELGNRGVGFVIVDNEVERETVVVRPLKRAAIEPLDPDEVAAVFAEDGPLGAALARGPGGYERRRGQLDMALEVTRAMNEDGVVALEAGTGIGKSFAYLVPAVLWARRNKRRVVIATHTINLQEQLVAKDLPLLRATLDRDLGFALIKGRSNYACRRKAQELEHDSADLFEEEGHQQWSRDLLEWVERSAEGSLSELATAPPPAVWEQVMSETDKSLSVNCPHYSTCFFYEAKRRAFRAEILVVNHHLFFADLAVRRETGNYKWDLVLPAYERVVFDEAHHLEDVASHHLGVRFSDAGIERGLARLVSTRRRGHGVLPSLARRLRAAGAPVPAENIEQRYSPVVPEIAARVGERFEAIATAVAATRGAGAGGAGGADSSDTHVAEGAPTAWRVRLTPTPDLAELRRGLGEQLAEVRRELRLLADLNDRAVRLVKAAAALGEERKASLLLDLTSLGGRLERLLDAISFFVKEGDAGQVRWVDVRARPGSRSRRPGHTVHFSSSPIRVGSLLCDAIFKPLKTVVLTSATLSVAGRSDYFDQRVGLDAVGPERFRFSQYDSPFDYTRQARLLVPIDLPEPRDPSYERRVTAVIERVLEILRGRTFVLFTSYAMLRRVRDRVSSTAERLGVRLLVQGEANRSELLERFRHGEHNMLLGTDSFWEGVDVKGRALECVVIARLPFRVPNEPLQLARVEEIEERGEPAFQAFVVPQAVLKFKQGFGRLIRSTTDRGVVLVLDPRVVTKSYGRTFLDSLPPLELLRAPTEQVLATMGEFLGANGPGPLAAAETPAQENAHDRAR